MTVKVWDETWKAVHDGRIDAWDIVEDDQDETMLAHRGNFLTCHDPGVDEARAKLAAVAPEMARLLLELENVVYPAETGNIDGCPICRGWVDRSDEVRHEDDCRWVAVLRKAGVK